MQTRKPIVAGQFYPAQNDACIEELNDHIQSCPAAAKLPDTICAGIVPHAGWLFSGNVAAATFAAIKEKNPRVHTFIIFGAAHSYLHREPAVYEKGFWRTPLGEIPIDQDIAEAIIKTGTAISDPSVHSNEHSIEVQVPFIQYMFPGAKIVPVITPPCEESITLGDAAGKIIAEQSDKTIICIGSTDLTHYGPRYGFTIKASDDEGIEWAKNVNDAKFIELALAMDSEKLLENAVANSNACGPGAAAAVIQAAKKLGKTSGMLLAHTTSYEVMLEKMASKSSESVGYASIVY